MEKGNQDYQKLLKLGRQIKILSGVNSFLEWDQETYMPPDALNIRSDQIELLSGMIHKLKTGSGFLSALSKLIRLEDGKVRAPSLKPAHQAALQTWRRDYMKLKSLSSTFVKDFAKLTSQAKEAWQIARKENAFHKFSPFLDRIVAMSRRKAELYGYEDHPYDALLDDFEPNLTTKEVNKVFSGLQKPITQLLKQIGKAKAIEDDFLFGRFPKEKQLDFGKQLLVAMGYDMNKGRLDLSAHPFSTSSHPTDCRITTRIHPSSLMSNIFAVLHEAGHALYEMGLPEKEFGSPLCEALSLGLHESQSRWWETRIGRSLPFWKHFFPLLKQTFKGKLESIHLNEFYRGIHIVKPSFIRIEADEVTYSLHVIIRFEIEKGLIEGSIAIRDIPDLWNEKMEKYLGIKPKTDSEGCLQDIHWAMGAFGYFPSYVLGTLYASQFFETFAREFPDWEKRVADGDLLFIKDWLLVNIHQYGREFTIQELLKKVTGKAFSEKPFLDYMIKKYQEIYKI